jgi:hypothetical protein
MMHGRLLAVIFLHCAGVLFPQDKAVAQNVKSTFDKSVDFKKYKKYTRGSNYLLTRQTKEDQERINMAIINSINRNLKAGGFVEDDKNPEQLQIPSEPLLEFRLEQPVKLPVAK